MAEGRSQEQLGFEPRSVAGKAVIVTGGTTGIGRATARLLAAQGARVLIFGRHEEELNEALDDIRRTGEEVHGLTADQARIEEVQRVFETADQVLGELDILVNNAAVSAESLLESELEELRYTVETNLLGPIACAREAARRMQRRGEGHIVTVGSMSADLREGENSAYVATKSALQGFSESLRKTLNPGGIKVTLIEPGRVATDMVEKSREEKEEKEEELEMLRPEDIAACVHYCLIQPKRCDIVVVQIRPHLQTI